MATTNRIGWMIASVAIITLLGAGCGSSPDTPIPALPSASTSTAPASSQAPSPSPSPSTVSTRAAPSPDQSPDASGFPQSVEPRAVCLQAMSSLQDAGADTLEPGDPAVGKTLTACRTVSEWRGGLEAVPGALGHDSAAELNDQVLALDLQSICTGNLGKPVCKEALQKKLL